MHILMCGYCVQIKQVTTLNGINLSKGCFHEDLPEQNYLNKGHFFDECTINDKH